METLMAETSGKCNQTNSEATAPVGWPYALRLAGWPDDRPVWTGSCPCQPFSGIGKRRSFEDPRHLWPDWYRLVRLSRPPDLFGEQVTSDKVWLDVVFSDLEHVHYSCGAADIPAASIGARHVRQRLWFAAYANETRWQDAKGQPSTETQTNERAAVSVVHRPAVKHLRGSFEPDAYWVVYGLPGTMGAVGAALEAFGNSIVPQVAAEFIGAYMECRP